MEKNTENIMEQVLMAGIKEQRSSRRWKIFFRLIWLIIIIAVLYFAKKENRVVTSKRSVGVVSLGGIISDENKTYSTLSQGLENALQDSNTVGVIIRANSPGGSPVYSDMAYNEIQRLRRLYPSKPINVVIEEVCASGCYYIASGAEKIYASPSSIVGSIGVIYSGFGLTNLMQKIGVDSRLLIAGKNKAMGSPYISENKTQNKMQQEMLDKVHQQFINAVITGRNGKLKLSDPDLFSGRYWIGEQGKELGLIDGYATVNKLARDVYHTDNIVDFTPNRDPIDKISKKLGLSLIDTVYEMFNSDKFNLLK